MDDKVYKHEVSSVADDLGVMPLASQIAGQSLQKVIEGPDPQALGTPVEGKVDGLVGFPGAVVDLELDLHDDHQQDKLEHSFRDL